jgi:ATP-dependent RNA helicase SUPV3L1/SUV3
MQLWALQQGDADIKGMAELPALAASGRTSIPVDKDIPKSLYRTIGYRVCGERAVRVDILERLADLIRPALAWRPNAPGPKPAGAVDGSSFMVTGAMTSLAGSSGEDFASVLRSLGYRMEQRPKPPEEPADVPAENSGAEGATALELGVAPVVSETVEAAEATVDAAAEPEDSTADATTSGPTDELPAADLVALATAPVAPPADEGGAPEPSDIVSDTGISDTGAGESLDAAETSPTLEGEAPKPVEDALIEVWRPGRFEERRPHRSKPARGQHRPPQRHHDGRAGSGGADTAPVPPQEGQAAAAADGNQRPTRERDRSERPGRQRGERPERERGERVERNRNERPDRDRGGRSFGKGQQAAPVQFAPRERREKVADPNSPFAKLAALKEQLEASAKERR